MPLPERRLFQRFSTAPRYYATGLWKRMNSEPVFIWAQAVAFKVLIAILPLILIATGVFGLILRQPNPFENVATYLRTFLPPGQSEPLIELLFRLQQASPTLTIIGIVVFTVIVVTLLTVLRYIIGTAMGSGRHRYRTAVHGYLFDVRMLVQVGLLFVLSFTLTAAVAFLTTESRDLLIDIGLDPALLDLGQVLLVRIATLLIPFVLSLLMFWQLFFFIPRPRPPVSSAFFGAFVAGVLFEAAKYAFTLYATYLGQFNRYTTGDEALGGVFGLVIAFVLWVYFSGLVLIIGAMLVHLHELRNSPDRSRFRAYARKYLFRKHHGEGGRRSEQRHQDTSRPDEPQEPEDGTADTDPALPPSGVQERAAHQRSAPRSTADH